MDRCDNCQDTIRELQKRIIQSKSIIERMVVNKPNTYSGTDIMTNQTKMFAFDAAVKDAIEYLKEIKEKLLS